MLVQFTIDNFRSFKEETTFSMQTAPYLKKFTNSNTFQVNPINILKSAVIFGPNGSGKTNLLEAMKLLESMILKSYRISKNKTIRLPFQPFEMADIEKDYTFFSIVLFIDDKLFNLEIKYNEEMIIYESLKVLKNSNDLILYEREFNEKENKYNFDLSEDTPNLTKNLRKNVLYLSLLMEFNNDFEGFEEGKLVYEWFQKNLVIINADDHTNRFGHLIEKLEEEETKENVLNFLKIADFNIIDIEVRKRKHEIPDDLRPLVAKINSENNNEMENFFEVTDIYTVYNKLDINGDIIGKSSLHADSFESRGTLKMILISLILLEAIDNEKTVFIDEFDNAFHLEISSFLLRVFNSPIYNKNSQFIINTHDISLMDSNILRVDQIWLAEKKRDNVSDLFSLYDFNGTNNKPRSDISFAKDYLKGKFGGLPVVNNSFFDHNIFIKGE